TRIISIASLVAAVVFPLLVIWRYAGTSDLKFLLPISLVLAVFIFYTHRANIQRLRQGTEKKLL
ncbi:MAG TPA: glycerol-3-phosphate acyltransferase, partial [Candidatus Omnitrophota bacterium]|nr:glycerol-3-phosphate acyltransferase [Candidatus Omnitrophota bacterium]